MPNGISTIADFYKEVQERDFLRQNQLRVIAINAGPGFNVNFTKDDLVYVKTSRLPTRNVQNSQATFMGLDFNIPGNVKYEGSDSYPLTFWADQKLDLWNRFQDWTRQIFNDENSSGNYLAPKAGAIVSLATVDNELNPTNQYNLIGVACRNVGQLDFDVSDTGTIHTFPVTLSYHFWTPGNI